MGRRSGLQPRALGGRHVKGRGEGSLANRELDCVRRGVVIGHREAGELGVRLPVARSTVDRQRGVRRRHLSRELSSLLGGGNRRGWVTDMDAHEDYVWPRATSELILLPVTGLECVGERLLAGEVWLEASANGEDAERSHGRGSRTKGCPEEEEGRLGAGPALRWEGALEVAGLRPHLRGTGDKKPTWLLRAFTNCS